MLLDELHAQRDAIQTLSCRYGARRIRVFGSVARREERADSDVDFLVDFPRGFNLFVTTHAVDRSTVRVAPAPSGAGAETRTESLHSRAYPARSGRAMSKPWQPYALHIPDAVERIHQIQAKGNLTQDQVLYDAALRNLQTLSEATQQRLETLKTEHLRCALA